MAVRRLPVIVLALLAGAAAPGQEPAKEKDEPADLPAPRVTELPPFLACPPPVVVARPHCHPCLSSYDPNLVYIPEHSPDYGAGSCDGECRPCRVSWCYFDVLCAKTRPLGDVDRRISYGWRVGTGYWFDTGRALGADVNLLNLHDSHNVLVAGPTRVNSPFTVTTVDLNARLLVVEGEDVQVHALAGYRYLRLHEELFIGNAAFLADLDTKNHLNAAQVGAVGSYRYGAYICEVLTKLAAGPNDQVRTVNGVRTSQDVASGLFELGARAGCQIGEGCWATIGFTFLYLTNMERPRAGDTTFYLHGVTFGFEARY